MTTVYIDRKGASISHERSRVKVRYGNEKQSILARHIDRIVVITGCTIDSHTLLMLSESNIPVVIVNPRQCSATWCGGWHHGNTERRLAQYALSLDSEFCTKLSAKLVRLKLIQQRNLLKTMMPVFPDKRRCLFKASAQLLKLIRSTEEMTVDEIRGNEGSGARIYFKAYCKLFSGNLNFTGRNRRPPRDPVNACLSLSYTLLMSDALHALYSNGLDPSLGFYHSVAYNRQSLACDLLETVRAKSDYRVLGMFKSKFLHAKLFNERDGAVFLNKEGRSNYYSYWEEHAQPIRKRLHRTASFWAKNVDEFSKTGKL
ncbi:MAG: CRISPR-associated endonuclease Cas1 [Gammaproteobacteria bacterium]|nr:CRISPR-associated endonuclease Cas1 [Gammaproteobacteria bacterium]